jgi:[CysO sulfur-carrier protein]-S-L-cysteine hydrolase
VSPELRLPGALADEIVAHCERGRPNEACGILAARDGTVARVFAMSNAESSPVRYSLDPREQLAVYKELDNRGWELGAVFHSHTRTEAYPSPTDVRLASEDVPYLIVSLATPPPSLRAFRILKKSWGDATGEIVEVPVVITK